MKTNYQMLMDLYKVYTPETRGVVTLKEIRLIQRTLHLDEMDEIQLQNLRDFVVAITEGRDMMEWDRMSAITSVIDMRIQALRVG